MARRMSRSNSAASEATTAFGEEAGSSRRRSGTVAKPALRKQIIDDLAGLSVVRRRIQAPHRPSSAPAPCQQLDLRQAGEIMLDQLVDPLRLDRVLTR